MVDYAELMTIFSRPRPNGSQGELATRSAIRTWLVRQKIPYKVHTFTQYPFFFESLGVWLLISRTVLAVSLWLRRGWLSLLVAIAGLAGGTLDVIRHIPLVTWPGKRQGENFILEFSPPDAQREILISAHYDSKTELLDHRQRMFFLKSLRPGILLSILLGLLGPIDQALHKSSSPLAKLTRLLGLLINLPLLFLAWAYGINLASGRFLRPSQGAIDNGSASAVLLGLASRLAESGPPPQTRVTLCLFTAEEVDRQGSRAYVSSRSWPLPARALNLEILAQDGPYVIWEFEGSVFHLDNTDEKLNGEVSQAVEAVTGTQPVPGGPITSDGAAFLEAGIPTTVLGTYDRLRKDTGFHRPGDNLERVVMTRIPEAVDILETFIINSA